MMTAQKQKGECLQGRLSSISEAPRLHTCARPERLHPQPVWVEEEAQANATQRTGRLGHSPPKEGDRMDTTVHLFLKEAKVWGAHSTMMYVHPCL